MRQLYKGPIELRVSGGSAMDPVFCPRKHINLNPDPNLLHSVTILGVTCALHSVGDGVRALDTTSRISGSKTMG